MKKGQTQLTDSSVVYQRCSLDIRAVTAIKAVIFNGNNLMTHASKLKVDRGIPGEPILYLSGKYHM